MEGPRFHIATFGCQMNVHDSERMMERLEEAGFRPVPSPEEADLIVLNTCSVREKAEQKLRSEVGRLKLLKHKSPDKVLCVAGCVAQQEGEALLRRVPDLDLVVGPDNLAELPALFHARQAGGPPLARTVFDLAEPEFLAARPKGDGPRASAFVTTMKGCDERCSFCIVPTTRGPERYRPLEDLLSEVEAWVSRGVREIVLLGQTVDSYRDPALPPPPSDDPDESQFPALLRRIAERVPTLVRLRYTSPHPRHLTESLAAAHRDLPMLAEHVHMPVQSGSDRMLRRMIRRYTRGEYTARIGRLRSAKPGLSLSTDIIVGFPGETEQDFQETLSLVEEVGFSQIFAFKYSPRPKTPALRLADDVSEDEKRDRLSRLLELSGRITQLHLAQLVGTTARVLLEGRSNSDGRLCGRTERNEIVHVPAPASATGTLVEVRITKAFGHSLEGELLSGPSAGPSKSGPARRSLPVYSSEQETSPC